MSQLLLMVGLPGAGKTTRAVELAARVPDAAFTDVEVRPVLDLRGMEM